MGLLPITVQVVDGTKNEKICHNKLRSTLHNIIFLKKKKSLTVCLLPRAVLFDQCQTRAPPLDKKKRKEKKVTNDHTLKL